MKPDKEGVYGCENKAKINSSLIYLREDESWVNPDHIVAIRSKRKLHKGSFVKLTDVWRITLSDDDCSFDIGRADLETLAIFLEVGDDDLN